MATLRQLLAVGNSFAGLSNPRQAFRYSLAADKPAGGEATPEVARPDEPTPSTPPLATGAPGPVRALKGLPAETRSRRRQGSVARMLLALNPWLACRVDDHPVSTAALGNVRVVRNDLHEADLEVAPAAVRTAALKNAQRGTGVRLSAVNIATRSEQPLVAGR